MARVILRDGMVADLRRAGPTQTDELLVRELFADASPESLYYRFFHMVRAVSDDAIASMLVDDGRQSLSVLCVSGGKALGIGTYVRQDESCAEVALMVRDNLHGHGVGTLLLEALAGLAWQYGFRRFEANVLAENQRMLKVFRASGFEESRRWVSEVYQLSLGLGETEATRALQDTREKFATAASLLPFFHPRHVAVVGASRDARRLGHLIFRHILNGQYQGTVYPVNPSAESISGVKAYPSVGSIPAHVDLALIVVPAWQVPSVIDDCIDAGVRAALITSSGFREVGQEGARLEQAVLNRLRAAGCRLIGPNGLGLINTHPDIQLNASFAPTMPSHGHLAIASQSGALGIAILDTASRIGIGVSSFCSTGNKIDVSSNDLLLYWEDDTETQMIALYLESFGNPRKFSRIARRIGKKKPIMAVKSARTPKGASASKFSSHAMLPKDDTVEALFRQAGIIRLDTLQEVFDVCALLTYSPFPAGKRVAVVTNTAGGAVMVVDAIERSGLEFVGPPVDLGWEALPEGYREVLPQVLQDPAVDAVVVLFSAVGVSEEAAVAKAIVEAAEEVQKLHENQQSVSKPVVCNFLTTGDAIIRTIGEDSLRIPVYPYPEQAVHALARVADYAAYVRRPTGHIPDLEAMDCVTARNHVRKWLDAHPPLEPSEAMQLSSSISHEVMASVGLPCCKSDKSHSIHPPAGRIVVDFDALFGPILHVHMHTASILDFENPGWETLSEKKLLDWGNSAKLTRLVPLTDVDAEEMALAALLDQPELANSLKTFLLRISRLVDEVPEVRSLNMEVGMGTGMDACMNVGMNVGMEVDMEVGTEVDEEVDMEEGFGKYLAVRDITLEVGFPI